MKYSYKLTLLIFIISIIFTSCHIYSFTGASIDPEVKTVTIDYFKNQATIVNSTLSQTLTEALKDKFLTRTSLKLIDENGDLHFSGTITSYTTSPQAITNDQVAAMNRLSITIKVNYENAVNDKNNFNKNFTRYKDYDSSLNLNEVESSLVEEIVSQLIDDIFNEAVVNW